MRYKSQATNSPIIFLSVILILLPAFFGGTFLSIEKLFIPAVLGFLFLMVLIFYLQWYEIKDDRIVGRQVFKMEIPFSSIKNVTVVNQANNLRVRKFSSRGIKTNFRLTKDILKDSFSAQGLDNVTADMDELNKATTVAKIPLPIVSSILLVSTDKGEVRILPKNTNQFLQELSAKFRVNQGKELLIETKGLTT